MQRRVAERRNAERAAHVDQLRRHEQPARGRDRERDHHQPYGVVAGAVDRVIHRPRRAEIAGPRAPGEPTDRHAGARKGDDLLRAPLAGFFAQERHVSPQSLLPNIRVWRDLAMQNVARSGEDIVN